MDAEQIAIYEKRIIDAYADGFRDGKQAQREEQRGVWRKP